MKSGPVIALLLSAVCAVPIAHAQPRILLHVLNPTTTNAYQAGVLGDCQYANTRGDLYPRRFFSYVLVVSASEVAGAQFGITYDGGAAGGASDHNGIDVLSWTSCSSLEFRSPGWPNPATGNLVTWDINNPATCQWHNTVVAGYFYTSAYSPGTLQLIPRPVDGLAKVVNCSLVETVVNPADLGSAAFSAGFSTYGFNPCCGNNCPPVDPPPVPTPPGGGDPPPTPLPGVPKILLHLTAPTTKDACLQGALDDPATAVTSGDIATASGPFYFAYLLVAPGELGEVAGVQCGISYDGDVPGGMNNGVGIDVFAWVNCATLQFPSPGWPEPGTGNLITWERTGSCQRGHTAVAGYFYVGAYSTDQLRVVAHPAYGSAKMATCSAAEFNVDISEAAIGFAAFSPGAVTNGCNPAVVSCAEPTPVRPTTWGGVKTLYGQ